MGRCNYSTFHSVAQSIWHQPVQAACKSRAWLLKNVKGGTAVGLEWTLALGLTSSLFTGKCLSRMLQRRFWEKNVTLFPVMEDHLIMYRYSKHKKAQEMSIPEALCIKKFLLLRLSRKKSRGTITNFYSFFRGIVVRAVLDGGWRCRIISFTM